VQKKNEIAREIDKKSEEEREREREREREKEGGSEWVCVGKREVSVCGGERKREREMSGWKSVWGRKRERERGDKE